MPSCFLIGSDTLLSQCGEVLLSRDMEIAGVITSGKRIADWARGHKIEVISTETDYASLLKSADFDYLFAITHLAVIPDEAVNASRAMAVNFHDGPLPKYAGLNAPLWALMNGETSHGITWHTLNAGIDAGDILLRHPVSISDDDTGLSLNTKCFAAALESFPVLVDGLMAGDIRKVPQNLAERTYYSKFRKPDGAAVLDWRRTAIDLERIVRALNVGSYANPLASAKLLTNTAAYIVTAGRAEPAASTHKPGQIVFADGDSLKVATGDGVLSVSGLSSLDGKQVSILKLAGEDQFSIGRNLPIFSDDELARLRDGVSSQARNEVRIVEQLVSIESVDVPYRGIGCETDQPQSPPIVISVPEEFGSTVPDIDFAYKVVSAFGVYLARLTAAEHLTMAVEDARNAVDAEFDLLYARHSCLGIQCDDSESVWSALAQISENMAEHLACLPWLKDLVAREPKLTRNPNLSWDARLPVAAVIEGRTRSSSLEERAELLLRVVDGGSVTLEYRPAIYSRESAQRIADGFSTVLNALISKRDLKVEDLELVSDDDRECLLEKWNNTAVKYDRSLMMHSAFEQQAERTPDAVAVYCNDEQITFRELNERADQLSLYLESMGVAANSLVGVHVERSIELVIAALGVLKAGLAYVPLDPLFPVDRLEFMINDSSMPIIISSNSLLESLPKSDAIVIDIDSIDYAATSGSPRVEHAAASPKDLAYVIYTSGSTGTPKGVMIEHRNVVNFFVGMDARVPGNEEARGVWLAVTSLSFDISVLEIFWTLSRGFTLVLHEEARAKSPNLAKIGNIKQPLGLGLFMWGNDDAPGPAKYRLLMEGAKFFDQNGFVAVWTPERHFHAFGGPYPNPAVTGAAVAAITANVKIRAGSCVVPLHHPIRIAEEWSVVDNLSNGRVEIAAASGWNPNDFVLKPESHANNKDVMMTQIDQVRRLWRGETLAFPGPLGKEVEVQSLPRPVQAELPVWITTAGNPDTWRSAGAGGFNVLTHLLGQTVEEVGEKIRIYREARATAGFDPAAGQVALMLHTFVGEDDDEVREIVREPMKSYLASSMRLAMNFAWSFPAFKRPGGQDTRPEDVDIASLSDEEVDTILDFAFDRYFSTSGLLGCVDTCLDMLRRCSAIGVSEIACLLDFGVETELIMQSLPLLKSLREKADADVLSDAASPANYSFAGVVARHGVTHMQCTPSMARMYLADADAAPALKQIPNILLGGEALPAELAKAVNEGRAGTLTNMYGPTETTIWSTTHAVENADNGIPIGHPIANTRCYILDKRSRPVPVGVPGELYIGGDGVARGYLNRPELTAERFARDPFAAAKNARMYATGDLAKYRDDGKIEYLGRTDFQVKIRGYRIELGEIEAVLESHEDVAEAAVIVRVEDDADRRLVGFVVGASGVSPDAADLKSILREKLPDYMVPSEISILPEMPRTANGKLDRKALMALRTEKARVVTADAAPQDDTQRNIAELWQKVLKLDKIGIDENFFDLGGHSLLIVQLHNQLKQALNAPLSLTDLYQYPTIRSLSAFLSSGRSGEALQKGASRGARRRALRSRSA